MCQGTTVTARSTEAFDYHTSQALTHPKPLSASARVILHTAACLASLELKFSPATKMDRGCADSVTAPAYANPCMDPTGLSFDLWITSQNTGPTPTSLASIPLCAIAST